MININKLSLLLIILFMIMRISLVYADEKLSLPKVNGKNSKILKEYYRYHKQLSKLTCSPGTEQMFDRLLKNYRGNGYYLPLTSDEELDRETISKFLPEIKAKITWIEAQKKNLSRMKNLITIKKNVADLKLLLNIILKQKKILYRTKSKKRKMNADNKLIQFYKELKKKYSKLISKTPFFLPYKYPADYFALREEYEKYKLRTDDEGVKRANEIFFLRKIVEDGSAKRDHSGNDLFLRTTISSLYLSFKAKNKYLTEKQRYDLDYVLNSMERYLKRGKKHLYRRFSEWEKRTKRIHTFYQDILKGQYKKNGKIIKADEVAKMRSASKFKLKKFVLSKMGQVYKFWAKKDRLMQALYSMETILFNEVGAMDGRDGLERMDVAQVVINRYFLDEYATLPEDEPLHKNLYLSLDKDLEKYRWLNILFKEGEFSFTFYYMPISVRIFCPSLTKRSKRLRHQNLKISLNRLRKPKYEFAAVRYFSRASMLGRIDMTTLWDDYVPIKERAGLRIKKAWKIRRKYKKNQYKLFYRFSDPKNKEFDVIEVNDSTYVKEVGKLRFFKYRSPHMFKYFKKK